jgi:hypothetical protein
MLDRVGGSSGGFGPDEGGGSDFGASSGGRPSAPARQPAMAGAGRREDMDDEIPF